MYGNFGFSSGWNSSAGRCVLYLICAVVMMTRCPLRRYYSEVDDTYRDIPAWIDAWINSRACIILECLASWLCVHVTESATTTQHLNAENIQSSSNAGYISCGMYLDMSTSQLPS